MTHALAKIAHALVGIARAPAKVAHAPYLELMAAELVRVNFVPPSIEKYQTQLTLIGHTF